MKKQISTISSSALSSVTGGSAAALPWSSIWRSIKPHLPPTGPTIPLGPFTPPKPDKRWIA